VKLTTSDVLKLAAGFVLAAVVNELLVRYVFPRILPPAVEQRGLT
jgi:hypothetical protein